MRARVPLMIDSEFKSDTSVMVVVSRLVCFVVTLVDLHRFSLYYFEISFSLDGLIGVRDGSEELTSTDHSQRTTFENSFSECSKTNWHALL